MPSGSISSKFHLELELDGSCPNEPQVLVVKYRVCVSLTKMPLTASSTILSRMTGEKFM